MPEPTMADLAIRLDHHAKTNDRLAAAIDRLSDRIDAMPEGIDRTYVRKDVAAAEHDTLKAALADLAGDLERHMTDTKAGFDKVALWARWAVAGVLVPTVLAIIALLYGSGGMR